jgi:hypothetical protein
MQIQTLLEVLDLEKCFYCVYVSPKRGREGAREEKIMVSEVPRKRHWFTDIILPAVQMFILDLDQVIFVISNCTRGSNACYSDVRYCKPSDELLYTDHAL